MSKTKELAVQRQLWTQLVIAFRAAFWLLVTVRDCCHDDDFSRNGRCVGALSINILSLITSAKEVRTNRGDSYPRGRRVARIILFNAFENGSTNLSPLPLSSLVIPVRHSVDKMMDIVARKADYCHSNKVHSISNLLVERPRLNLFPSPLPVAHTE